MVSKVLFPSIGRTSWNMRHCFCYPGRRPMVYYLFFHCLTRQTDTGAGFFTLSTRLLYFYWSSSLCSISFQTEWGFYRDGFGGKFFGTHKFFPRNTLLFSQKTLYLFLEMPVSGPFTPPSEGYWDPGLLVSDTWVSIKIYNYIAENKLYDS